MSALLIDLPLVELPAPTQPRRWMHVVPGSAPADAARQARPVPRATPGSGPVPQPVGLVRPRPAARPRPATPSGAAAAPLRLTRRGLAVVVGGFSLLMMTALVVLVVSFLAVSNDPVAASLPLN